MPVNLKHLKLETLADLEPRLATLVEAQLATLATDCILRPNDKRPRKLTLTIDIRPVARIDPQDARAVDVDHVKVAMATRLSMPNHQTRDFPLDVNRGGFAWNSDDPTHLDQQNLFPEKQD